MSIQLKIGQFGLRLERNVFTGQGNETKRAKKNLACPGEGSKHD
jgi:hypothetical protein